MQGNFISFPRSVSAPLLFPLSIRSSEEEAGGALLLPKRAGTTRDGDSHFRTHDEKEEEDWLESVFETSPSLSSSSSVSCPDIARLRASQAQSEN